MQCKGLNDDGQAIAPELGVYIDYIDQKNDGNDAEME